MKKIKSRTRTKKSYMPSRKSSESSDIQENEKFVEKSPSGRYLRFNEILGEGSSKIVYKGIDGDLMREIAWNSIDAKSKTKDEKQRIVREIELLNSMNHPNIMKFYGSWLNRDINNKIIKINFATEMSTGSLKSFLYRYKFFKLEHVKNWCRQILEGLKYLHEQGIIHRDLKCENIFIHGDTSEIFIGDFGLSLRSEKGKSSVGTPEYMAPELFGDTPYDDKIDMYAFGMCMLEMLTLESPYSECSTIPQIYRKIINGILPESLIKVRDLNSRQIIIALLSFDQNKRPSAVDLLQNNFFKKIDESKIPDEKM
jgi:WNK lysine deficient protein kinase